MTCHRTRSYLGPRPSNDGLRRYPSVSESRPRCVDPRLHDRDGGLRRRGVPARLHRFDRGPDVDPTRIQVIAVDDGSTDGSPAILEAWARRRPTLVTVLHQPNGGQGSARNLGLAEATGDWVTFTDPDDMLDPDYFAVAERFALANPDVEIMARQAAGLLEEAKGRVTDTHPRRAQYEAGDRVGGPRPEPDVVPGQSRPSPLPPRPARRAGAAVRRPGPAELRGWPLHASASCSAARRRSSGLVGAPRTSTASVPPVTRHSSAAFRSRAATRTSSAAATSTSSSAAGPGTGSGPRLGPELRPLRAVVVLHRPRRADGGTATRGRPGPRVRRAAPGDPSALLDPEVIAGFRVRCWSRRGRQILLHASRGGAVARADAVARPGRRPAGPRSVCPPLCPDAEPRHRLRVRRRRRRARAHQGDGPYDVLRPRPAARADRLAARRTGRPGPGGRPLPRATAGWPEPRRRARPTDRPRATAGARRRRRPGRSAIVEPVVRLARSRRRRPASWPVEAGRRALRDAWVLMDRITTRTTTPSGCSSTCARTGRTSTPGSSSNAGTAGLRAGSPPAGTATASSRYGSLRWKVLMLDCACSCVSSHVDVAGHRAAADHAAPRPTSPPWRFTLPPARRHQGRPVRLAEPQGHRPVRHEHAGRARVDRRRRHAATSSRRKETRITGLPRFDRLRRRAARSARTTATWSSSRRRGGSG